MTATITGKTVRLIATAKESEGCARVRRAGTRPYLSATRLLRPLGFDGAALDIEATPVGASGFEFRLQ
jgi:hypothetical protein